jgi:hypothetical protein
MLNITAGWPGEPDRARADKSEQTHRAMVDVAGGQAMPNVVITNILQYEAATHEAQHLTGADEDTPEERRLIDLVLAIKIWDVKHDDATVWKD